jgi:hypothetical protein
MPIQSIKLMTSYKYIFHGSQNFVRVEGHVGIMGWDSEELTIFTSSHGPKQHQHKVVSA